MNQTIIGVDYSLKSPAVCILTNNELKYFVFPRTGTLKPAFIKTLQNSGVVCTTVPDCIQGKTSQEKERYNSKDAALLAETLCSVIREYVTEDTQICLEGISFNSPGNTKVQYAGYHFVLRYVMHQMLNLDYERMHVYAPMSVKSTAGKGNFKKGDMINAFLNSEYDYINPLKKYMISDTLSFQSPKAHNWKKPVDDLIDSFWTLKTYIRVSNEPAFDEKTKKQRN